MHSRLFTWPSRLERFRSLARTTAVVAGAMLVAFHGWLFAAQVAAGARFDHAEGFLKTGASAVPEWVAAFKSKVRAISDGPACPR